MFEFGNAVGVRIDCVTVPGGWERIAAWVCSSECARRCEARVDRERSSSEVRSGRFVGTVRFFGRATSRYSLRAFIFRNEGVHATVQQETDEREVVQRLCECRCQEGKGCGDAERC